MFFFWQSVLTVYTKKILHTPKKFYLRMSLTRAELIFSWLKQLSYYNKNTQSPTYTLRILVLIASQIQRFYFL